MSKHAKLGPSAADRWMSCTASVALIDELTAAGTVPPDDASEHAAEGTVAHAIRENMLVLGDLYDPYEEVGRVVPQDGYDILVTEEMIDFLRPGVDWILERTDNPFVEVRVRLDRWLPGQFGTCDTCWVEGDTLYVSDLKYGRGVVVEAEGNRQARLYALGAYDFLGRPAAVRRVVLMIDQPRAGGLKFWDITLTELLAFGEEVRAVGEAIREGRTAFAPGEKACRWCRAREGYGVYTGCPAYNAWQIDRLGIDLADLDGPESPLPAAEALTPAQRWGVVRHAKSITTWLKSLERASLDSALAGQPDPGSRVVLGQKGDRYFTDAARAAEIAEQALGNAAFKPREVLSLTALERLLKPGRKKRGDPEAWAALSALVDQPPGRPTLTHANDKREGVAPLTDHLDDLN